MKEFTKGEIRERFRYDKIQSQQDVFFDPPSLEVDTLIEILDWSHERGFRTFVEMLHDSCARQPADKSYEEVKALIDEGKFFVIVLRKNCNLFMMLTDEKVRGDFVEIGVRGIDVGHKEYFIRIYLEPKYLDDLIEKYKLVRK